MAGARPADRREPGHHPQQDTRHLGGRPPSAARALAAGPDRAAPAPEPGGAGAFPSPPLFARQPTAAHSSLWHLPVRPVQPAVAADDASLGDVGLLATSIVGTGHRCAEPAEPRQDAYRVARDDPGEHVIVAVADGISSCRFSDLAAAVAVSAAVNTVRRMLADRPESGQLSATELFDAMAEQMRDAADQRRISHADFGVVAIVAVIPTRGEVHDGSRKVWMGWLGDVSAWELLGDRWSPVTGKAKADDDGVESGEIDAALPWAPHAARSGMLTVPGGTTMAFVTDGVGDALGNNPRINRYFSRVWARKPPLTEFVNDMSFDAPSCQDDRTAVVIWTGQ